MCPIPSLFRTPPLHRLTTPSHFTILSTPSQHLRNAHSTPILSLTPLKISPCLFTRQCGISSESAYAHFA